jgi:glycosyltransferase involved in cell wall biosynthesis
LENSSKTLLSIIIPAYNEEHRLPRAFEQIEEFRQTISYDLEVIIVENGSRDRTAEVTKQYAEQYPYIRLLQVETRGKGLAVKAGMLAASGDYRFMADADFSMPVKEIHKFLPPKLDHYDIAIGSREANGAKRINEPEYRHIIGRVNTWIIKLIALRGFEDTQCGFKMFTGEAAEDLFSVQQANGIGFDVELIYIAVKRGYRIEEIGVTWYFDAESKMRLVQDSWALLKEIWAIRHNWREGLYDRQSVSPTPTT